MKKDYSGSGFLSQLILTRSNFVELVVVAVLLALSIHLIGGTMLEIFRFQVNSMLYLGLILTLFLLLYLSIRLFGLRSSSKLFTGFFTYSKEKNKILTTNRYRFSEELARHLKAAFVENPAMKVLWEEETLKRSFEMMGEDIEPTKASPESYKLIIEATEYFVLEELSSHLVDYFNDDQFKDDKLREFSRDDIPSILLQNRFLELFSKSMRNRAQFVKNSLKEEHTETIVMSHADDGALYKRFDLVLPVGTKLSRVSPQSIKIKTNRFTLVVNVSFEGMNTFIPFEYHKYVQKIADLDDVIDYQVEVQYDIWFNFGALFMPSGWHYYRWIDSFLQRFEDDFSEKAFFKKIGWEKTLTMIECMASYNGKPDASRN